MCAQGRITPKLITRYYPNSNSFELPCLSSLPASLTKIQSKVTKKSWWHHFFTAPGYVTPKWLVRYDQSSNLSEILCLSLFPVSLMKTEFKVLTEKRWRSSLIRVYTVCHSVCIVWTHYSMVEPHSSNFKSDYNKFLGVRIFRKFMVHSLAVL